MAENKNIYAVLMDRIRNGECLSLQSEIRGEEGRTIGGISRSLVPVTTVTDGRGRSSARVVCLREEQEASEGTGCPAQGQTENPAWKGVSGSQENAPQYLWTVQEPVIPGERVIVLGGGHIGREVCAFAARCGFSVTVCDERLEFANKERFPEAAQVLCGSFADCIAGLQIMSRDYVVIVTRGHARDSDCLRKILAGTEPTYTGLIGSRRRVHAQFDMLEKEGFSREKMNRIYTPIGLNIGGVTPAEIALSVVAEIIARKRLPDGELAARGGSEGTESRIALDSDLQLEVMEYLAEDSSPKAVVTVLSTAGSAPRGAGAKMAVFPGGGIIGTIGGGQGEGEAIRQALEIIGTGTYRIRTIEMHSDVAEEEGMACGGSMQVLIEDF